MNLSSHDQGFISIPSPLSISSTVAAVWQPEKRTVVVVARTKRQLPNKKSQAKRRIFSVLLPFSSVEFLFFASVGGRQKSNDSRVGGGWMVGWLFQVTGYGYGCLLADRNNREKRIQLQRRSEGRGEAGG